MPNFFLTQQFLKNLHFQMIRQLQTILRRSYRDQMVSSFPYLHICFYWWCQRYHGVNPQHSFPVQPRFSLISHHNVHRSDSSSLLASLHQLGLNFWQIKVRNQLKTSKEITSIESTFLKTYHHRCSNRSTSLPIWLSDSHSKQYSDASGPI